MYNTRNVKIASLQNVIAVLLLSQLITHPPEYRFLQLCSEYSPDSKMDSSNTGLEQKHHYKVEVWQGENSIKKSRKKCEQISV